MVIYPEGSVTRDPDWWPMQARTGVARLALTTDVPIVPVAQWGPQRVHDYHARKLHLRPRQPADYLVGPPIDLTQLRAEVRAGRALTPDLLGQGQTDANTIRYVREDAYTNAATTVAEEGAKPEATFDTSEADAAVRKIAVTAKITDELYADFPAMRTYIDGRLRFMVGATEEDGQ